MRRSFRKDRFVLEKSQSEMKSLLSAIEDTRTRYIRCIKPNNNTENDVKKEMEQTTSPAVQENYLENSLCEGTMGSLATGDDEVFVVSHLIIEQSVVEQSVSNIAEEVCGEKVEERYLQAQMEENAVGDDTAKKKQSASLSQVGRSQRSLQNSTGKPTNPSRDASLDPIQRLS
jgi:hypothetical protein